MKVSTFAALLSVVATANGARHRHLAARSVRGGVKAADFEELVSIHSRRLMMSKGSSSSTEEEGGMEKTVVEAPTDVPTESPVELAGEEAPVASTDRDISIIGLAPIETPTVSPTLTPSDVPSDVPSGEPSEGVEIPVGGTSETETPTLGPSESMGPSGMPSDVPSEMPSSLDGEGRKLSEGLDLDTLGLFDEDPSEYLPAESVSGTLELPIDMAGAPTPEPSASPAPSGGPSDVPSLVPSEQSSDGGEGRKLGATAVTGTLILPVDLEPRQDESAPSLAPSASPGPSDEPSLSPSASPAPSGGPSDAPSGVPISNGGGYVVEIVFP